VRVRTEQPRMQLKRPVTILDDRPVLSGFGSSGRYRVGHVYGICSRVDTLHYRHYLLGTPSLKNIVYAVLKPPDNVGPDCTACHTTSGDGHGNSDAIAPATQASREKFLINYRSAFVEATIDVARCLAS